MVRELSDPKGGSGKLRRAVALCGAIFVAVLCVLLLSADPPRLSAAPLDAAPTLTAISPTEAYNYQATTITITGTNFTATPTVTLGIMPLTDVGFVSSTTLTATVPADLPGGSYTLTVKNPDGQSASLANAFTVLHSSYAFGPWQTTTPMTTTRTHFAVVEGNGYLYTLGGCDAGGGICTIVSSVEQAAVNADGSLGPWQTTTPLIAPRNMLAAVQVGGYIYVLGGYDGSSRLNSVEQAAINADGSLGSWQATTSMTTERSGLAAVAAGGNLYALGGDYGGSVEWAALNADGTLGPWQVTSSLPSGYRYPSYQRYFLSAVAVGNYLYALGGHGGPDNTMSVVERAAINPDGSLSSWEEVRSMTGRRSQFGAVAADGYIYVFGGSTFTLPGVEAYDSVERAEVNPDSSLGPWEVMSSMTTPRRSFAAVKADYYLFALGGANGPYGWNHQTVLDSVERAAIAIDITAPTADGLTINGGALNTTSTSVAVTVPASDSESGVAEISFSSDGSNWSSWQSYSVFANWSLATGDGLKTAYGRVRDGVGYVSSVVSDTIELDTTAPTEYGLTINEGALFTNKVTVTLTIGAPPGTAQMQVSNDGGFAGAVWEPYASRKAWEITQYGSYVIPRVVYVRYKDYSGNVSATYQDDIILDVTAPTGSVEAVAELSNSNLSAAVVGATAIRAAPVNPTDSYSYTIYLPIVLTGPANVTLYLQAEDDVSGVADMMISHLSSFNCTRWEPYATTKAWYAPEEATTVYVKFRDHAGNVSEVVTDTITW